MDHIVWIKEGGSWRILACYGTRREAFDCFLRNKADGEQVRYVIRGSRLDLEMRENVFSR